ncbi:hypothetical protein JRO89_XS01G0155500 [Xanthoceras sorbifolium]|uniref:Uncharacterized protein n=1 Tax=Xanthoceras sorbifolium TaxID=99658 RepID=A0ABQ8IJJ3_9ROSI|nr:hypothetical protein JRO89_XS01G0155500 [Xanthoceras sorbifolium]
MALHLSCWLPLTCTLQKSNNNARINQQVKCAASRQISYHPTNHRRSANYQPSVWSYNFLQSLQIRYADDKYTKRAEKLEEEVRCKMIHNEDAEMLSILELIDDIQRLGLGHRFEKDIKSALDKIVSWEGFDVKAEDQKLHAIALRFRLLRQHGYQVSPDVFRPFMDDKGKFMEYIKTDVKGMLNLYEASYLAFEGENVLDEALTFSTTHLNGFKTNLGPDLSQLVSHALELPLHRRMIRLEARWYIEAYSQRKYVNGLLLELAKLDFNMVQSVLQNDLKDMSRWDLNAINDLPDYMKLCFMVLYNTINEMAYDSLKEHGENVIPYLTKAWGDLCKAFLQEAKWSHNKHTPTFEDYFDNAWRSVSGTLFLVHSYFLVSQNITKEALESLDKQQHNLMRSSSIIFRLCNDLGTSTAELERGETASSILCYIRQTGVSEEVAREHIRNIINETWKKMNKDVVDNEHPFGKTFVETAINLARISHSTYQYGDGHGAPDVRAKRRVHSLIIDPISLT